MCSEVIEVSYRCDKSFELIIICLLIYFKKCYIFFEKEIICVYRNNFLILLINVLLYNYIYFDERNSFYLDKIFFLSVLKNLIKFVYI